MSGDSSYVEGSSRDQLLLMPELIDDYVGEDNEVRFIDAFVDSLDLNELGFQRSVPDDGAGRPPYDPSDLLKLYIYGYLNRVRTSRKLEKECLRNLEVMWLMGKLAPDFKTIADFRKDNIGCIRAVFREFVKLCMSLDLYGKKLLGIDGVKFKAVNSIDRNFNQKTLANRLKEIDERVSRYMSEMEKLDGQEQAGDTRTDFLSGKIKKLREKKERYAELLKKLKESKQYEVSLTDPDSRLMKNRGRLEPCYNSHVAVDDKNHLIADYNVNNISADNNQLSPMAKSGKEALGVEKVEAVSDRGFFDAKELKECVDNGITPYVPEQKRYGVTGQVKKFGIPTPEFYGDKFLYDKKTDTYTCPAGKRLEFWYPDLTYGKVMRVYKTDACFSCPFFMTRCTRNKIGRTITRWEHEAVLEEIRERMKLHPEKMDERKKLVEHPFGTIKRAFNQGYLLMKGLGKADGEVGFTMLTYNMRRAINILGPKALLARFR